MTVWEILLCLLTGVIAFSAVPYAIGYWFTRGKVSALEAEARRHAFNNCNDPECPMHGQTEDD